MTLTSGETDKIKAAVAQATAALLARESNADITAEKLADEITEAVTGTVIGMYEEFEETKRNLIVLGHFRLEDDTSYVAAVGPLSTTAPARARAVGERFAWDYKTRTGSGRYVLVPLIRDPAKAWDDARNAGLTEFDGHLGSITPGVETSYEPWRLHLPEAVRAAITADWQADPEIFTRATAAGCTCGLSERYITGNRGYSKHGIPTMECPRHPNGSEGDS